VNGAFVNGAFMNGAFMNGAFMNGEGAGKPPHRLEPALASNLHPIPSAAHRMEFNPWLAGIVRMNSGSGPRLPHPYGQKLTGSLRALDTNLRPEGRPTPPADRPGVSTEKRSKPCSNAVNGGEFGSEFGMNEAHSERWLRPCP
jgi:hypothetical protein